MGRDDALVGVGRGRPRRLGAPTRPWPGWRASWATLDAPAAPSRSTTCACRTRGCPARSASASATILRDDRAARVLHARGKSYPDLVRQRAGDCTGAPDAVLTPRDHDEVRAVLEACAGAGVAVVPFGGGTSVVGGLEPLRGGFDALVSLDLGALDALESLDERSQVAVVGGGMRAVELEARLGERGFTLGHYPQSYEYVTIGGCAATRSAGQASTGYGRIDELVRRGAAGGAGRRPRPARPAGERGGSRAAPGGRRLRGRARGDHPRGACACARRPRSPATRAGCSRASAPAPRRCGAWSRTARRPTWRGSPTRTRRGWGSGMTGLRGVRAGALQAYLRARGVAGGSLAIVGWAGPDEPVRVRREAAVEALRDAGGVALGQPAGRAWVRSRFHGPYLRDELMDRGVLVETLETATTWAQLFTLVPRGGRRAARPRAAGRLPRLAPVSDGRVAVLHLHGAGAARRGARAVGAR